MWLAVLLIMESLGQFRAGWVDSGLENGQRTAVNLQGVPRDTVEPFYTSYIAVPRQPSGRARSYTLWLASWDCQAGTRRRTWRIEYSPHHDPRRVELDEDALTVQESPSVARQLSVLCDRASLESDDVMSIAAFVAAD